MPFRDKTTSLLTLSQAQKKVMDLVAGRDQTELQLRQKLSSRCEPEVFEAALDWAREKKWLASSEQMAERLGRSGKGIHQINAKLQELGLEPVQAGEDAEFAKALKVALAKFPPAGSAQKSKSKILGFLAARGFDEEVALRVLQSEYKDIANQEDSYDEEF